MLKKGGAWEGKMQGGGLYLWVYYTRDEDDRSKCVSESPCPCKGGTEWSSCIRASGCKEGMGNIQKQMSLHMPIYRNKEQNSNTDISHTPLICNFFNMQVTQKIITVSLKIFQIIKTIKLFFLQKIVKIHKIIILRIMIERFKAKTRRLDLSIQVEQLHRQPHSPI